MERQLHGIYHCGVPDCRSASPLQYAAELQDHQWERLHSQDTQSPNIRGKVL